MSQKFSGGLLRLFFKMLKWSKKFHSIKIFCRKRGCCRLLIPIALMPISEFFFVAIRRSRSGTYCISPMQFWSGCGFVPEILLLLFIEKLENVFFKFLTIMGRFFPKPALRIRIRINSFGLLSVWIRIRIIVIPIPVPVIRFRILIIIVLVPWAGRRPGAGSAGGRRRSPQSWESWWTRPPE